jgi:hypothetical protein
VIGRSVSRDVRRQRRGRQVEEWGRAGDIQRVGEMDDDGIGRVRRRPVQDVLLVCKDIGAICVNVLDEAAAERGSMARAQRKMRRMVDGIAQRRRNECRRQSGQRSKAGPGNPATNVAPQSTHTALTRSDSPRCVVRREVFGVLLPPVATAVGSAASAPALDATPTRRIRPECTERQPRHVSTAPSLFTPSLQWSSFFEKRDRGFAESESRGRLGRSFSAFFPRPLIVRMLQAFVA